MGLTVHFKLAAPADCSAAQAKRLVESMRRVALRFQREGLVDKVFPLSSEATTLRRFALDWLVLPLPGEEDTFTGVEVCPARGFLFRVDVGEDCEPLWLGLCRYPGTILHHGHKLPTETGARWRLAGFSKTQYASLHGWEHFQRCHCAVIDLLAALRPLGFRVSIRDEGGYWPRRSAQALRAELHLMNGLVAATAGAWKDLAGDGGGTEPIQSPIFRHPQYERLEAEGAARGYASRLRRVLKRKP